MKLGYCVAAPDISSPEVTAWRGEWAEIIPALAGWGYQGMELVVRDPEKAEAAIRGSSCREQGLEVAALCTGELFGEEGLSLLDPTRSIRERAFARLKEVIDLAAAFLCPVNIGRVRGCFHRSVPVDTSWEWITHYLAGLARYAENRQVVLALEPVNRFQCNFINSTQDGLGLIKRIGSPALRLMLDLFHMNIEDRSIEASIEEAAEHLVHVHICDSNRHAPGQGHLNFQQIMAALRGIGYRGYLSGEISPVPDSRTAARLTAERVAPYLGRTAPMPRGSETERNATNGFPGSRP